METKSYEVGKFTIEVNGQQAVISDPCYELGAWCQAVIPARRGEWTAYAVEGNEGEWDWRVRELIVVHESTTPFEAGALLEWTRINADIGVDSGQCGIFGIRHFRNDAEAPTLDQLDLPDHMDYIECIYADDPWYAWVCSVTHPAGVVTGGVASTSGYGDGGYDAFAVFDRARLAVAIKIVFIEDEEDE